MLKSQIRHWDVGVQRDITIPLLKWTQLTQKVTLPPGTYIVTLRVRFSVSSDNSFWFSTNLTNSGYDCHVQSKTSNGISLCDSFTINQDTEFYFIVWNDSSVPQPAPSTPTAAAQQSTNSFACKGGITKVS